MYSFMTIIIIVVVGITAGISYLIADYFFQIKEQELAEKGNEMGETVEAFIRLQDRDMLYRYILAVDKLVQIVVISHLESGGMFSFCLIRLMCVSTVRVSP